MTEYRVGDRVTIEFEINSCSTNSSFITGTPVSHCDAKVFQNQFIKSTFDSIVKSHTPKPIEPAAGQTWKAATGLTVCIVFVDDKNVLVDRSSTRLCFERQRFDECFEYAP